MDISTQKKQYRKKLMNIFVVDWYKLLGNQYFGMWSNKLTLKILEKNYLYKLWRGDGQETGIFVKRADGLLLV
ncbi:hypothetical protein T552_04088 [Pneumocystis carinii B80]|uniref:Uncharacterized protein n=1 Tax=Pneumocystis carinii (strain B80) TaxID=1408658 RepID=A0A0W4ZPM8_PNEC8|nr:hypothetical protein T552_04088 [Pneumocystis carinii B80]KTW30339.1 hypothetical protein T552_04088 [Pneumocystis carinii B80]